AFACGSSDDADLCESVACADGATEGSTAPEAGADASVGPQDGGEGGSSDASDAADAGAGSDGSVVCTGAAGTLDPTFGDGGIVVLRPPGSSSAWAIAVQSYPLHEPAFFRA
ncbi:MAG: hypothetical protein ACSLFQ_00950, partial [Thermoanaerobaculia bacterium]